MVNEFAKTSDEFRVAWRAAMNSTGAPSRYESVRTHLVVTCPRVWARTAHERAMVYDLEHTSMDELEAASEIFDRLSSW